MPGKFEPLDIIRRINSEWRPSMDRHDYLGEMCEVAFSDRRKRNHVRIPLAIRWKTFKANASQFFAGVGTLFRH